MPVDSLSSESSDGSVQERPARQEQLEASVPRQSRVLVQPLILGTLSLPSAKTQTTVGAAGGASALPATPTGYLTVNIGNTTYVIPFYAIN